MVAVVRGSTMGVPFLAAEGRATLLRCLNCSKDIPASPKLVPGKSGLTPSHHVSWELAMLVLLFRWIFPNQLPLSLRSIVLFFLFCQVRYSPYSLVTRKRYRVRMIQWITP